MNAVWTHPFIVNSASSRVSAKACCATILPASSEKNAQHRRTSSLDAWRLGWENLPFDVALCLVVSGQPIRVENPHHVTCWWWMFRVTCKTVHRAQNKHSYGFLDSSSFALCCLIVNSAGAAMKQIKSTLQQNQNCNLIYLINCTVYVCLCMNVCTTIGTLSDYRRMLKCFNVVLSSNVLTIEPALNFSPT